MKGFLCEESIEGIFTGIYDAWASGLGHENVKILLRNQYEPELFFEYEEIIPEKDKAEKVARSIRKKISPSAFRAVYQAAMSWEEDRADAIYRFLVEGFRRGACIVQMLQLPAAARIFSLSRAVANEAHRFLQFVRFEQLDNGVLFASISPKSQVLTLIAPHFEERYSGENWIIYDRTRGEAAVHEALNPYVMAKISEKDADDFLARYGKEDGYTDLWKTFFKAVGIKERENYRCQRNFLPLWYRKHMTEFL